MRTKHQKKLQKIYYIIHSKSWSRTFHLLLRPLLLLLRRLRLFLRRKGARRLFESFSVRLDGGVRLDGVGEVHVPDKVSFDEYAWQYLFLFCWVAWVRDGNVFQVAVPVFVRFSYGSSNDFVVFRLDNYRRSLERAQ